MLAHAQKFQTPDLFHPTTTRVSTTLSWIYNAATKMPRPASKAAALASSAPAAPVFCAGSLDAVPEGEFAALPVVPELDGDAEPVLCALPLLLLLLAPVPVGDAVPDALVGSLVAAQQ